MIEKENFLENFVDKTKFSNLEENKGKWDLTEEMLSHIALTKVNWLTGEFVYQINLNRIELKKGKVLKNFHKWL